MPRQNTIQLRKGAVSQWIANNSQVLASGEPAFETDTLRLKIGDGSTAWSGLNYIGSKETLSLVRNDTGDIIYAGQTLYVSGIYNNSIPSVAKYVADGSISENLFIGLASSNISNNSNGYATSFGQIDNLNTIGNALNNLSVFGEPAWTNGTLLYAHPTAVGKLTSTPPTRAILVGTVIYAHGTEGKISVKLKSQGIINELYDVNTGSALANQYLLYDGSSWIPTSSGIFNSVGIGTTSPTADLHVNGSGLFSNNIIINGNDTTVQGRYGRATPIGNIALENSDTNFITFRGAGTGLCPTNSIFNSGLKILLRPVANGAAGQQPPVAIGLSNNSLWNVVSTTGWNYEWNAGANNLATLSGNGILSVSSGISSQSANFTNNITASGFVVSGGTSSQFLKADGSVDSTNYQAYISDLKNLYVGELDRPYVTSDDTLGNVLLSIDDSFSALYNDNTVVRTTGNQTIFGGKRFQNTLFLGGYYPEPEQSSNGILKIDAAAGNPIISIDAGDAIRSLVPISIGGGLLTSDAIAQINTDGSFYGYKFNFRPSGFYSPTNDSSIHKPFTSDINNISHSFNNYPHDALFVHCILNGSDGNGTTIDGVVPASGQPFLINNKTFSADNGVYIFKPLSAGATVNNTSFIRYSGYQNTTNITENKYFVITNGNTYKNNVYVLKPLPVSNMQGLVPGSYSPLVIGTDVINFELSSSSSSLSIIKEDTNKLNINIPNGALSINKGVIQINNSFNNPYNMIINSSGISISQNNLLTVVDYTENIDASTFSNTLTNSEMPIGAFNSTNLQIFSKSIDINDIVLFRTLSPAKLNGIYVCASGSNDPVNNRRYIRKTPYGINSNIPNGSGIGVIDNGSTYILNSESTGNSTIGTSDLNFTLAPGTSILTFDSNLGAHFAQAIVAKEKYFRINHPDPESKYQHLQYGSLESPYHGVRLTGKGRLKNGVCTINLPDYIKHLVHTEDINIQLTNKNHYKIIFVDNIDLTTNSFTVKGYRSKTGGPYEFYWTFTGVRKDVDPLIPEI